MVLPSGRRAGAEDTFLEYKSDVDVCISRLEDLRDAMMTKHSAALRETELHGARQMGCGYYFFIMLMAKPPPRACLSLSTSPRFTVRWVIL